MSATPMIVDSADNGDLEFSLDELVNSPEGKGDASSSSSSAEGNGRRESPSGTGSTPSVATATPSSIVGDLNRRRKSVSGKGKNSSRYLLGNLLQTLSRGHDSTKESISAGGTTSVVGALVEHIEDKGIVTLALSCLLKMAELEEGASILAREDSMAHLQRAVEQFPSNPKIASLVVDVVKQTLLNENAPITKDHIQYFVRTFGVLLVLLDFFFANEAIVAGVMTSAEIVLHAGLDIKLLIVQGPDNNLYRFAELIIRIEAGTAAFEASLEILKTLLQSGPGTESRAVELFQHVQANASLKNQVIVRSGLKAMSAFCMIDEAREAIIISDGMSVAVSLLAQHPTDALRLVRALACTEKGVQALSLAVFAPRRLRDTVDSSVAIIVLDHLCTLEAHAIHNFLPVTNNSAIQAVQQLLDRANSTSDEALKRAALLALAHLPRAAKVSAESLSQLNVAKSACIALDVAISRTDSASACNALQLLNTLLQDPEITFELEEQQIASSLQTAVHTFQRDRATLALIVGDQGVFDMPQTEYDSMILATKELLSTLFRHQTWVSSIRADLKQFVRHASFAAEGSGLLALIQSCGLPMAEYLIAHNVDINEARASGGVLRLTLGVDKAASELVSRSHELSINQNEALAKSRAALTEEKMKGLALKDALANAQSRVESLAFQVDALMTKTAEREKAWEEQTKELKRRQDEYITGLETKFTMQLAEKDQELASFVASGISPSATTTKESKILMKSMESKWKGKMKSMKRLHLMKLEELEQSYNKQIVALNESWVEKIATESGKEESLQREGLEMEGNIKSLRQQLNDSEEENATLKRKLEKLAAGTTLPQSHVVSSNGNASWKWESTDKAKDDRIESLQLEAAKFEKEIMVLKQQLNDAKKTKKGRLKVPPPPAISPDIVAALKSKDDQIQQLQLQSFQLEGEIRVLKTQKTNAEKKNFTNSTQPVVEISSEDSTDPLKALEARFKAKCDELEEFKANTDEYVQASIDTAVSEYKTVMIQVVQNQASETKRQAISASQTSLRSALERERQAHAVEIEQVRQEVQADLHGTMQELAWDQAKAEAFLAMDEEIQRIKTECSVEIMKSIQRTIKIDHEIDECALRNATKSVVAKEKAASHKLVDEEVQIAIMENKAVADRKIIGISAEFEEHVRQIERDAETSVTAAKVELLDAQRELAEAKKMCKNLEEELLSQRQMLTFEFEQAKEDIQAEQNELTQLAMKDMVMALQKEQKEAVLQAKEETSKKLLENFEADLDVRLKEQARLHELDKATILRKLEEHSHDLKAHQNLVSTFDVELQGMQIALKDKHKVVESLEEKLASLRRSEETLKNAGKGTEEQTIALKNQIRDALEKVGLARQEEAARAKESEELRHTKQLVEKTLMDKERELSIATALHNTAQNENKQLQDFLEAANKKLKTAQLELEALRQEKLKLVGLAGINAPKLQAYDQLSREHQTTKDLLEDTTKELQFLKGKMEILEQNLKNEKAEAEKMRKSMAEMENALLVASRALERKNFDALSKDEKEGFVSYYERRKEKPQSHKLEFDETEESSRLVAMHSKLFLEDEDGGGIETRPSALDGLTVSSQDEYKAKRNDERRADYERVKQLLKHEYEAKLNEREMEHTLRREEEIKKLSFEYEERHKNTVAEFTARRAEESALVRKLHENSTEKLKRKQAEHDKKIRNLEEDQAAEFDKRATIHQDQQRILEHTYSEKMQQLKDVHERKQKEQERQHMALQNMHRNNEEKLAAYEQRVIQSEEYSEQLKLRDEESARREEEQSAALERIKREHEDLLKKQSVSQTTAFDQKALRDHETKLRAAEKQLSDAHAAHEEAHEAKVAHLNAQHEALLKQREEELRERYSEELKRREAEADQKERARIIEWEQAKNDHVRLLEQHKSFHTNAFEEAKAQNEIKIKMIQDELAAAHKMHQEAYLQKSEDLKTQHEDAIRRKEEEFSRVLNITEEQTQRQHLEAMERIKKEHAQLLERQQQLKHVAAETALNLKRQEDEIARREKEHQETTFKLKRLEEETAQKERKQQVELAQIQRKHSELLQKQKESHSEEFDQALRENEARLKLAETNLIALNLQHEEAVKEAMKITAERNKDSLRHEEAIEEYKERHARTKEEHLKMRALLEKDVMRHEETIAEQTARHAMELVTQQKEYEARHSQLLARSVDSQEIKYRDTLQETEEKLAKVVQHDEGKHDKTLAAYEARASAKKDKRKEEQIQSHGEATSKVGAQYDANLVQVADVEGEEIRRLHTIPPGWVGDNGTSGANSFDAEKFVRLSTSSFVGELPIEIQGSAQDRLEETDDGETANTSYSFAREYNAAPHSFALSTDQELSSPQKVALPRPGSIKRGSGSQASLVPPAYSSITARVNAAAIKLREIEHQHKKYSEPIDTGDEREPEAIPTHAPSLYEQLGISQLPPTPNILKAAQTEEYKRPTTIAAHLNDTMFRRADILVGTTDISKTPVVRGSTKAEEMSDEESKTRDRGDLVLDLHAFLRSVGVMNEPNTQSSKQSKKEKKEKKKKKLRKHHHRHGKRKQTPQQGIDAGGDFSEVSPELSLLKSWVDEGSSNHFIHTPEFWGK